LSGTAA